MPSTQEEQAAAAVEVQVEQVDHHTNNVVIPDDDEEDLEEEYDDEDEDSEDDDDEEDEDDVVNHKPIHHHNPTNTNTNTNTAIVVVSASTPTAIPIQQQQHLPTTTPIPIPIPISQPSLPIATPISTPTPAPIPTLALTPTPTPTPTPKPSAFDDSRKLFQRLWTDEDEIGLLQGFLDYTSQRGGFKNSAYHHDTAPFYDQIKSRLQLDFNKSQLVEKLRRLKKKFRNVMSRINSGKDFSFKTPHDQATFDISRKIWSDTAALNMDDDDHLSTPGVTTTTPDINGINSEKKGSGSSLGSRSRKRPRIGTLGGASAVLPPPLPTDENIGDPLNLLNCPLNSSLPNVIEETIKSCISPLFKEFMFSAVNGPGNLRGFGGMASNILPLNFGNSLSVDGDSSKDMIDDKWRKQQILELEVYSKRVELVQDQIKLALEELRSMDSQ